jgi:hypothetical protein
MRYPCLDEQVGGSIHTFSGLRFCPLSPRLEDIRIEDIAHALANQCRFGGHCLEFYSVAQHSVLVSQLCRPEDALWGLLHDASEAYLRDLPRPLKGLVEFAAYRRIERELQRCIVARFGVAPAQPDSVTVADDLALSIEQNQLMLIDSQQVEHTSEVVLAPMLPQKAKRLFLDRFNQLYNGIPSVER